MAARKKKVETTEDAAPPPLPRANLTEHEQTAVLLLAATPPTPGTRARVLLRLAIRGLGSAFKRSAERMLIYAVVGFVVGWLFNVVVIAVGYNGYGKVPLGAPATAGPNRVPGMVFCFITTALLVMLINHRRRVGGKKFWADVHAFPGHVQALSASDGADALQHALWGLAGSMLVIAFIGPWIVGVLAVGFLVAFVGVFRSLLTGLVMILWQWVGARLGRSAPPPSPAAVSVITLGGLGAAAIGMLVPAQNTKLLIAAAAAGGAFLLARRKLPATQAAALFVLATAALLALRAVGVLASDGGFSECGGQLVGCPGFDQDLVEALAGGLAAAAGAAAGEGLDGEGDDYPEDGASPP